MNVETPCTKIVVHIYSTQWGLWNPRSDIDTKIGDFMKEHDLNGLLTSQKTGAVFDKEKTFRDYSFVTYDTLAPDAKYISFPENQTVFITEANAEWYITHHSQQRQQKETTKQ